MSIAQDHNMQSLQSLIQDGIKIIAYKPNVETKQGQYKAINRAWKTFKPLSEDVRIEPDLNYAIRWDSDPARFVDIDLDCDVAKNEWADRFTPRATFGREGEGHLLQELSDPTIFGKHVIAFGKNKGDTLIEMRGNDVYSVASGKLDVGTDAYILSTASHRPMTYYDTKRQVYEVGLIAQIVSGYAAPMNDYLIPIVGEMCFQNFDIEYTMSIIERVHEHVGRKERWEESKDTIKAIYKKDKPSGLNTEGAYSLNWEHGETKKKQMLDVMKFLSPKQQEIEANETKKEFKPIETFALGTIMKTEYPPVKEIIKDLMTPGLFYFAAKPKMGKSFFVLQVAYAIATGGKFLDKQATQGQALMLCYEDHAPRIKSRAALMKLQPNDNLEFAFMSAKMGQGFEEQVIHWVESKPNPQLIVVDTYGRSHDASGRGSDAYEVGQQRIDRIQREMLSRDVCLVFVTHDKKAQNKDKLNNMTGTNAQQGQDGNWRLDKSNRADTRAATSFTFIGRDLGNQNFLLRQDDNFHWNFVAENKQQTTEDTDNILRAIEELCKTSPDAKPKEIVDWLFASIREDGTPYYDEDYHKTDESRLRARIKAMKRDKEIVNGKRQYSVKIADPNEFADNVIDVDFNKEDDDCPF